MKECTLCKENKSKDNFYKNKKSNDGYHSYCKDCFKEYIKEYRKQIKEDKLCQKEYHNH